MAESPAENSFCVVESGLEVCIAANRAVFSLIVAGSMVFCRLKLLLSAELLDIRATVAAVPTGEDSKEVTALALAVGVAAALEAALPERTVSDDTRLLGF